MFEDLLNDVRVGHVGDDAQFTAAMRGSFEDRTGLKASSTAVSTTLSKSDPYPRGVAWEIQPSTR